VDFKGWWRTLDGTRCDPLPVRDAVSRYVLAMRGMTRTRTEDVRRVFEELFDRYGLPKAIHSDNGPPFASLRGPGGLTQLSAWWVSLGIHVSATFVGDVDECVMDVEVNDKGGASRPGRRQRPRLGQGQGQGQR
jgi:putative transposase